MNRESLTVTVVNYDDSIGRRKAKTSLPKEEKTNKDCSTALHVESRLDVLEFGEETSILSSLT